MGKSNYRIKYSSGQRLGNLIFIERVPKVFNCQASAKFICGCGKKFICVINNVKRGNTTSCGCKGDYYSKFGQIKHGNSKRGNKTPEYSSWLSLKSRCNIVTNIGYLNYGGRGIIVCDRWKNSFENFLSDMGLKPTLKHTIDRINVNGNYEPSNCKWATPIEQARNTTRTRYIEYNNEIKSLPEWCDNLNLNYDTVHSRLMRGKSVEQSFLPFTRPREKIVLDTETGIYYTNIKEAAKYKNISYPTLTSYLGGRYPNKTSFILA